MGAASKLASPLPPSAFVSAKEAGGFDARSDRGSGSGPGGEEAPRLAPAPTAILRGQVGGGGSKTVGLCVRRAGRQAQHVSSSSSSEVRRRRRAGSLE